MTDLRNIIEVTFPDDGVSVLYVRYIIVLYYCFFHFIFIYLFLFLVGVDRPPGSVQSQHKARIIAEIPAKKGKTNIYIICIVQYVLYMLFCFRTYVDRT